MAKSIRSKWARKMRAIKRVRYGKKELIKLKKMLGIEENKDVEMKEDNVIEFTVDSQPSDIAGDGMSKFERAVKEKEELEPIETDNEFNSKLINKFGTYPIWMNHRKVHNAARSLKKHKRRVARKNKRRITKK